jgi:DNA-binding CsgD family transcriptional regulator
VELERGRTCYQLRRWADAFAALSQADQIEPLTADDLWLLAWSAHLSGRDDDFARAMGRAYRAHLDAGDPLPAARCAGWLGTILDLGGEAGPAAGWLNRAKRLVERAGVDCAEQGFLLLVAAVEHADAGDLDAMFAAATQALGVAERFGDADLAAIALVIQGRARLACGEIRSGLAMLDEAMVSVTNDELLPAVTGLTYCNVIEGCQEVYDLRRSQEWTAALTRWCDGQPDLVPYIGQCLVHRSEILQLRGDWPEALEEASRACVRLSGRPAVASAYYQVAELHRLRGEFTQAEQAYRQAGEFGRQPQPGLALLRLAEGRLRIAAATIARVLTEAPESHHRCDVLAAYVEIMLAANQAGAARSAADELSEAAEMLEAPFLRAIAAHALGAVSLAEGDPARALLLLRRAVSAWGQMDAPYQMARARVLVALACRALHDRDSAQIELDAARQIFQRLGAAPDVGRLGKLRSGEPSLVQALTGREIQVLSLVATGRTNQEISSALVISEHTVARHLQNIFRKIGVSTRTAAAAFAVEHNLF